MAKGSGALRQTAPHPASGCRLVGASVGAAVLWGFAFFRAFDAKGRATKHRKLRCFWPRGARLRPAWCGDWRFSGRACCESSSEIHQANIVKHSVC